MAKRKNPKNSGLTSLPPPGQVRKENEARQAEQQFEWVSLEERDSNGRPIVPRKALDSTKRTRFDPSQHTDLGLIINTGMAPEGAIIGQYKIFDISKFGKGGWRLHAEAVVDLEPYRSYEESWFTAFNGSEVRLNDPGLPGTISKEYKMKVTKTTFEKKVVSSPTEAGTSVEENLLEGRLWMRETVKSTLFRRKGELVRYIGLAIVAAVVGGVISRFAFGS